MKSDFESLLGPVAEELQASLGGWIQEKEGRYTERLKNISSALQKSIDGLRENNEEGLAAMLENATQGLDQLAGRVEDADPKQLVTELREMSRDNPAGVFLASLVAGFVGSRVGKTAISSDSKSFEATSSIGEEHAKTPSFNEIVNDTRGTGRTPDSPRPGYSTELH